MSLFGNSNKHSAHSSHNRGKQPASRERSVRPAPEAEAAGSAPRAPQRSSAQRRRKKTLRVVAIILVALVLLVLIVITAFEIWAAAPRVRDEGLATGEDTGKDGDLLATATPAPVPSNTPAPQETDEPEEAPANATGRREGVYTLLVVGKDVAGMNTDTIMVACFDTREGKLNVVSIPRDTLVNAPWAIKKVNAFYGLTGTEEGLVDGITELLGFKVDNYVVVDVYAFEQVVDAIGGVYFNVPVHMEWGDPTIGRSYVINAGEQWLDGYNALGVVRFRKNTDGSGYPTGDIGRVQTQQQFLMAAAKQMLKLGNIPNLNKIISIVTDSLKTNLSNSNLAFYAQEFLKLDNDDINFAVVPNDPVYIKGGSYVSIRLDEWLTMLNEDLNPYYETITESNLDVLTYTNGSFYATTGILAGGFESFYDYTA